MTNATFADILRPTVRRNAVAYEIGLALGGSLLLAASAQIAFRIGPVPLTAQTLAVVLLGTALGARRGLACVLTYLAEGAAGLPVFAGGAGTIAYMAGPTGGYLLGFAAAAWLTGALAEKGWDRHVGSTLVSMFLGHVALFSFGIVWLAFLLGNVDSALAVGLYPFVPGCILKVALGAALLPMAWRLFGRTGREN